MRADHFTALCALVQNESGLVLDRADEYAIKARLGQLARREQARGLDGLLARLGDADAALRRRICEAVTVNETRFFRDEHVFSALASKVIGPLVATGRTSLRVWSAACASGQEPYSVAMMLREHHPRIHAEIIASDLSHAMVMRTRDAVYTDFEVRRGLTPAQRDRHLVAVARGWQVQPALRAMVSTLAINLAGPWPALPGFDVVLLRNVLVYLDAAARARIIDNVRGVLAADGVLVLGAAESGLVPGFERCLLDSVVVHRPLAKDRR